MSNGTINETAVTCNPEQTTYGAIAVPEIPDQPLALEQPTEAVSNSVPTTGEELLAEHQIAKATLAEERISREAFDREAELDPDFVETADDELERIWGAVTGEHFDPDSFICAPPDGQAVRIDPLKREFRPKTDDELHCARLDVYIDAELIDARGDMQQQTAVWFRKLAKQFTEAARRVEALMDEDNGVPVLDLVDPFAGGGLERNIELCVRHTPTGEILWRGPRVSCIESHYIMSNDGSPEQEFETVFLPAEGVRAGEDCVWDEKDGFWHQVSKPAAVETAVAP